jgi:hypothetical protein
MALGVGGVRQGGREIVSEPKRIAMRWVVRLLTVSVFQKRLTFYDQLCDDMSASPEYCFCHLFARIITFDDELFDMGGSLQCRHAS